MRLRIGGEVTEGIADLRHRVEVYFEWRDLWMGAYVGDGALYICPLPTLVIRLSGGRSS